jgi:hypothetical protein
MANALMTVELDPAATDLTAAAQRLGVATESLDATYGVVPIDPDQHLYSVLVDELAMGSAASRPGVSGPFSNPRIEPFGPPR